MNDEYAFLAETQDQVQRFFFDGVSTLFADHADELAWDDWIASIRMLSEETWLRCNAFLLAHTIARFLARSTAVEATSNDAWVKAFVAAVAGQETDAELELWVTAPTENPRADLITRGTVALSMLTQALASSRSLDGARPGPYSPVVWIVTDDLGQLIHMGDDFV